MSDEQEEDPILAIRSEQRDLRARLDQLDLKVEKLMGDSPAPGVTSVIPENLGPAEPADPEHKTALSAAKQKSKHPACPPPIPDRKIPPAPIPSSPLPVATSESQPSTTAADLEMKVGMVWLVRVGVVMLLSALVFGSKLAYTAFIADLPPIGKASLWYLFSAVLVIVGTVLERKELLKNYARVLTAGGLAAVYYTTYAIHHVERLRVVESPLLAGILLLLCGLGVLGFALYKNSRNIAIAAVALAYYAGAISPLGGFAMFSNLLLTAVGITFLIRRRWATIGFVSLGATYATFLFWQFFYPGMSQNLSPIGFAPTLTYLTGYWLLFTSGAIIASPDGFNEKRRLAFSSINTAAYFLIGTLTVLEFQSETTSFEFWHFALALGLAQTALSVLPQLWAQIRDRITPLFSDILLASGLSFLTIAAFAKLDGYQLALTLSVESALLLFVHVRRASQSTRPPILLVGSLVATVLGALVTAYHYADHSEPLPLAPTLASFFISLALAHVANRKDDTARLFAAPSTVFIGAALAIGGAGLRPHLETDLQPLALLAAATALTFTSSWRRLRLPQLAPLAGFYVLSAVVRFVNSQLDSSEPLATPLAIGCIALGFALVVWWQRFPHPDLRKIDLTPANGLAALAFCSMLATTIHLNLEHTVHWQVVGGLTAVALLVVAVALRAWPLAFVATLFHIPALLAFFLLSFPDDTSTPVALLPSLLLTSGAAGFFMATSNRFFAAYALAGLEGDALQDARGAARYVANITIALATATFLTWAIRFFPDYATVVITLGGLVAFAAGLAFKVRTARLAALAVIAFALGRILIVDVWGFATFVRFITFFVIGAVLVALGFVYNRYQETLRKYL